MFLLTLKYTRVKHFIHIVTYKLFYIYIGLVLKSFICCLKGYFRENYIHLNFFTMDF